MGELSRKISKEVAKFIHSEEVQGLQTDIRATVEKTMDGVRQTAKEASDYVNQNIVERWEEGTKKVGQAAEETMSRTEAWLNQKRKQEQEKKEQEQKEQAQKAQGRKQKVTRGERPEQEVEKQLPIAKHPSGSISSMLMLVFGTMGAGLGGVMTLGTSIALLLPDVVFMGMGGVSLLLSATFFGLNTSMAVAGGMIRGRLGRFKQYVKTIGQKEVYAIEDLSEAVGEKEKQVIRDLKRMSKKGWFKEGHLDRQETCFILTNEAYQLYENMMAEHARRKEEKEQLEQDPQKKQLVLAIAEGNEYIRRIRRIHEDISVKEVSEKLERLEEVCKRIFEHVEQNPEKLGDIRRFMSYYLPTTLKLVEAYHGFYHQPVQGKNIAAARREIENTLDDINIAFEKMFDKLFQEDALDISADISVLSTLLAQEGLLEDGLTMKKTDGGGN